MTLLVLTSETDQTADYLCSRLAGESVTFCRLNTETCFIDAAISYEDCQPLLLLNEKKLAAHQVKHVWLRRPGRIRAELSNDSVRNQQIADEYSEALEGFLAHIPHRSWMNHPSSNVRASHKIEQLTRASQAGLSIPATLVTQDPLSLEAFKKLHKHLIAKPLASGWLEREHPQNSSAIFTSEVERKHLANVNLVSRCPTLFQEKIDKAFDVRVCLIDHHIHAVALHGRNGDQPLDIRRDNMSGIAYESIAPPAAVSEALASLLATYGLRFGAFDLAVDRRGRWVFFELNPNGQWAWLDLAGNCNIWKSFIKAFSSR